jgi:hypothetical protein
VEKPNFWATTYFFSGVAPDAQLSSKQISMSEFRELSRKHGLLKTSDSEVPLLSRD